MQRRAIARDILAEAMDRISAEGLNIVAHVHDEVIIEAPKGQYTVDEVCKLMSVNPACGKGCRWRQLVTRVTTISKTKG